MARIRKINTKFSRTKAEQTLTAGVDEMFGDGSDGDVTITSGQTIYLSNDMYYKNLTVQSGAVLFTNGFRIFVNDTLTNNGTIGMPSNLLQTSSSSTISGRSDTTKIYRWGEGSSGTAILQADLNIAVEGYLVTADGSVHAVAGGDPGSVPVDTVTDPTDGEPGQPGDPGTKPFASPGDPGGPGNPGAPGDPGTAATAGVAGAVGKGGGIILLVAKNITGAGSVESYGRTSTAGNPGVDGPDGAPGSPGNPAPDLPSFANLGSPYPAGVNAGSSTIPASDHPHSARPSATSPLSSVTGNLNHNAVITGGTYNQGSHSHGDVFHEDDIFDPINAAPFPTSGSKYNSKINAGEHSHPQKGSTTVNAPSNPAAVFGNSPTYPPGQHTSNPYPDSNVITTHNAVYTVGAYNSGFYHHGDGPTDPTYNPSTLHHGHNHVVNLNSPTVFPDPTLPHRGTLSPDHAPHPAFNTAPSLEHHQSPTQTPSTPFPANVNANSFAGPHNAPVTPASVNAGWHTHPADSSWSKSPAPLKAVLEASGPHPANQNEGHNANLEQYHNVGTYPAGHDAGLHHHPGAPFNTTVHRGPTHNSQPTFHHSSGHHPGNLANYHHPAGSHGLFPTNNHNHNGNAYHFRNAGYHHHGHTGTGPNPKNSSLTTYHNAGSHPHGIYHGHNPSVPYYPKDKHNHNGYEAPAPYAPGMHYHNPGYHPHGHNGTGPNPKNSNPYTLHNAGNHPHGHNIGHNSGDPFYPSANHNHNANTGHTHNSGNTPYHNPHGSHAEGSHSPNPTANHNSNANTGFGHTSGNHSHPGGPAPISPPVPAFLESTGHYPLNPGGTSLGHSASPHPAGSHPEYGTDNSPAHVSTNATLNPATHTVGQHFHYAAPFNEFHSQDGNNDSGYWMNQYSIATSPSNHTGDREGASYGAGNAPVPQHHQAGSHYHPAGSVNATSIGYLQTVAAINPTSNAASNAYLNASYWPSGSHSHATGPTDYSANDTINAMYLGDYDLYGPAGEFGHLGAGNHTGEYSPQGHNPGSHPTNRLAHSVGKEEPYNVPAHANQTNPVNSPAYIELTRPNLPVTDQQDFVLSTGVTQNPFSHGTGTHHIAQYVQPHGTGGELPAHGHTGTPYPAGHNTSYENLPYSGGAGGAGGAGGYGGDVTTTGSTNPGSTGGVVVVTQDPGNVQNQIGHSNFAKIINID